MRAIRRLSINILGIALALMATATLTAASLAALTVYDMCKAVDRSMRIEAIALLRKSGGKSGDFSRAEAEEGLPA